MDEFMDNIMVDCFSCFINYSSNVSLLFPTLTFPCMCPFTCDSQPPKETRIENVTNSRV